MNSNTSENYSDKEAALRRDEAIKRMLNTPPQPHVKKKPERKPKAEK